MKKSRWLLVLSILPLLAFQGTEVQLRWGPLIEATPVIGRVIGQTDNQLYAFAINNANYRGEFGLDRSLLQRYDKNTLELVNSGRHQLPQIGEEDATILEIEFLNNRMIVIAADPDKDNDVWKYYHFMFNEEEDRFEEGQVILEAEVGSMPSRNTSSRFFTETSSDHSKLILYQTIYNNDKRLVNIKLLSDDLEEIKSIRETLVFENPKEFCSLSGLSVTNDGSIFCIYRFDLRNNYRVTSSRLEIHQYLPSNGFQEEIVEIELGDNIPSSLTFGKTSDGTVVGMGLTEEWGKVGRFRTTTTPRQGLGISNAFFFRYDPISKAFISLKSHPIGQRVSDILLPPNWARNGSLTPADFYPKVTYQLNDDGFIWVSEYSYGSLHRHILIVRFSKEGEIAWIQGIPKTQQSRPFQTQFQSFISGIDEDGNLNFIFNDNPKNLEDLRYWNPRDTGPIRSAIPVSVTIDNQGRLGRREALYEPSQEQPFFMPKRALRLNSQSVLCFSQKGSSMRLGRIDF